MTHYLLAQMPTPIEAADPNQVMGALIIILQEMEATRFMHEPIEDRIDRLEAFALLSTQHTVNRYEEQSA